MAQVHIGEYADIHLAAYPDRVLKARISNILPDHRSQYSHRQSASGSGESRMMRLGMFVTATFHGQTMEKRADGAGHSDSALARSRLGLHSRRTTAISGALEVMAGNMLPDNMQEVISGSSRATRWYRTLWFFKIRWSNKRVM